MSEQLAENIGKIMSRFLPLDKAQDLVEELLHLEIDNEEVRDTLEDVSGYLHSDNAKLPFGGRPPLHSIKPGGLRTYSG